MSSEATPENVRTYYEDPTLLRDRQKTYAVPLSGTSFAEWVLDRIDLRTLSDVLDAGAGDQQVFPDAAALVSAYRTTGRFRAASDQVAIDEADLVEAAEQTAAEWVGGQGGELISPIVMGAFVGTGPHR